MRIWFLLGVLAALAGLAWWSPFIVLFSAPWLVAIALLVLRNGLTVLLPPDADAFPSGAEDARRRLAIR